MLIDSHCHLDLIEDEGEITVDEAMKNAKELGVEKMLTVSTRLSGVPRLIEFTKKYDNVYTSVGLHPNEHEDKEPTMDDLISLANAPKIIAIGETGLDYFRSEGDLEWQRDRFRAHIDAAKALKLPLIIHSREARDDTLKIMGEMGVEEVQGVMHCFAEDWDTAKAAMELGFYISFSGVVTFKNAKELQEVAKQVPLDRMLVETDSPYLAPMPHRGKRNQPAFVHHTAQFIADLRETSYESVAEATTKNFETLFLK